MKLFPILLLTLLFAPAVANADVFAREDDSGTLHLTDAPQESGFELLIEEADGAAPAPARMADLPTGPFTESVARAAEASGVDARLIHAVIAVESAHNPRAVSPKGAAGLMQLMPATARRYGVTDRFDPDQNVMAGAMYLRDLMRLFNNRVDLVLAAYNAGEGAVPRHGLRIPPFLETQRYVPRVLGRYRGTR